MNLFIPLVTFIALGASVLNAEPTWAKHYPHENNSLFGVGIASNTSNKCTQNAVDVGIGEILKQISTDIHSEVYMKTRQFDEFLTKSYKSDSKLTTSGKIKNAIIQETSQDSLNCYALIKLNLIQKAADEAKQIEQFQNNANKALSILKTGDFLAYLYQLQSLLPLAVDLPEGAEITLDQKQESALLWLLVQIKSVWKNTSWDNKSPKSTLNGTPWKLSGQLNFNDQGKIIKINAPLIYSAPKDTTFDFVSDVNKNNYGDWNVPFLSRSFQIQWNEKEITSHLEMNGQSKLLEFSPIPTNENTTLPITQLTRQFKSNTYQIQEQNCNSTSSCDDFWPRLNDELRTNGWVQSKESANKIQMTYDYEQIKDLNGSPNFMSTLKWSTDNEIFKTKKAYGNHINANSALNLAKKNLAKLTAQKITFTQKDTQ